MRDSGAGSAVESADSVKVGSSVLAGGDDTIVALSTAVGRGALAGVRVSGPRARAVGVAIGALPRGVIDRGALDDGEIDGRAIDGGEIVPRRAARVMLREPEGATIDDALATFFPGPDSYTGEDVLELSTHGGHAVPRAVLAACIAAGCRTALPGEFTRRAVLNGKMDLVQAEAVADLIDARTSASQRQALLQLDGGLSRRLEALRSEMIGMEALIAYDIDFPGEDDGPISSEVIANTSKRLAASIDSLLATAPRATQLRDGALVVIAGPPNAGKSSLFNALLGANRALVTEVPGTTRDAIEALFDRLPLPLRLVDTAGIRETTDRIELLGIEVSERYLGEAQIVLACGETDAQVRYTVSMVTPLTAGIVVPVRTKIDVDRQSVYAHQVSAESGSGLGELLDFVDRELAATAESLACGGQTAGGLVVTRERHRLALSHAREELADFIRAYFDDGLPASIAAVHLLAARESLGEVTGEIVLDDVLDRVFSDFCIGK